MEKINFEQSIARLEEIVNKLENNEANLDDSLKLFQEGIDLCKKLEDRLKEVETESVKILENGEEKNFNNF